jgi:hypothetical protein
MENIESTSTPKMPNCDFYALKEDCYEVLEFIFAQPGWALYELYSEWDKPVRAFDSVASVRDAFPVVQEATHFRLYAPTMRGGVQYRRIDLNPGAVPGASFRYSTEGWGLIQVYFGDLRDRQLSNSHTNHNTEIRARNWSATSSELGDVEEWDWPGVAKVSGRLVRYIHKLGVSKYGSRPVLPGAHRSLSVDEIRLRL